MKQMKKYQCEFEEALPRIERHARFVFRDVRCSHRQADLIAEAVALSWKWWLRLREQGKDPTSFVSAIATFAARAVRSGRRLCGQQPDRDVFSELARQRHGFALEYLPPSMRISHKHLYGSPTAQKVHDALEERLQDNTQTPVPDQVAFRLDFPPWFTSFEPRNRDIIVLLMHGERTRQVAVQFHLSDARVSQLRRAFLESWQAFHGVA